MAFLHKELQGTNLQFLKLTFIAETAVKIKK